MRLLLILAALVAAPALASAQTAVMSARPDKVAVTVYPELYGVGLAMVTETRTVDLPAGRVKISFQGVADQIVPQTAALQGLPQAVGEQNYDYQLLTPAALLKTSEGRAVTLARTDPATGKVSETRARVVSGGQGALLDIGGRIEALKCDALPERLVFDDLPTGFVARPTLSVETVSPRATHATLVLSYLTTGVSWTASYVARLNEAAGTLDLSSWITLTNASSTGFAEAPVQVVAGALQRQAETVNGRPGYSPGFAMNRFDGVRLADDPARLAGLWRVRPERAWSARPAPTPRAGCWGMDAGRRVFLPVFSQGYSGRVSAIVSVGTFLRSGAEDTALNVEAQSREDLLKVRQEDLGDYKLYSLPQPTTLAAHQTKQVRLFDRSDVKLTRAYRQEYRTAFGDNGPLGPTQAAPVLEMQNAKADGLGLAMPAGSVAVFETDPDGTPILVGEPTLPNTAQDTPVELKLPPSVGVASDMHVVRRWTDGALHLADISLTATNASEREVTLEIREAGGRPGLKVTAETKAHQPKDGGMEWRLTVPAHGSVPLRYTLSWTQP